MKTYSYILVQKITDLLVLKQDIRKSMAPKCEIGYRTSQIYATIHNLGEWTSNANNLSLTQSQPLADTSIAQSNDKGKQAAGTLKFKLKYAPGSNNYKRYYPTKRRIGGLASSNSGTSSPLSPSYKLRLRPNASKIDASASGAQMILRSSSSLTGFKNLFSSP